MRGRLILNFTGIISSRIPAFYAMNTEERAKLAAKNSGLSEPDIHAIQNFGSLNKELVDAFIENGVGAFSLPLGIATNFLVNGKETLIPMAVEESSVIAAASHGAKLARKGGGFITHSTAPIMIGQIQLFLDDNLDFDHVLNAHKERLLSIANEGHQRLLARKGGAKDITWRYIKEIGSLIIHVHVNTCDAMGANIVNTIAEELSPHIAELFPASSLGLRILSNLSDERIATAQCKIPANAFYNHKKEQDLEAPARIVRAWEFAWHDIYRATTHNKGVMNGIDPVIIATGNDWRAVEAGAHAYACKDGSYRPMTNWSLSSEGDLLGQIKLPMALGTVGGVTKLHPTSQSCLKLMGSPNAQELAEIVCAVGLAQNLSALRALASEGIQKGHMNLHQKNLDLQKANHST